MTDRKFSALFFGILNSFTVGMTLLTLATGAMEGFIICLIVTILIAVVSVHTLFQELTP